MKGGLTTVLLKNTFLYDKNRALFNGIDSWQIHPEEKRGGGGGGGTRTVKEVVDWTIFPKTSFGLRIL